MIEEYLAERERIEQGATGPQERERIDEAVCEIMMNDGPDGHVDGHNLLTELVLKEIESARRAVPTLIAMVRELDAALVGLLAESDCAFCDGGVLRKRVDGRPAFHADDCPYEIARLTIARLDAMATEDAT